MARASVVFPAPELANKTDELARIDAQVDTFESANRLSPVGREGYPEIGNREDRLGRVGHCLSPSRPRVEGEVDQVDDQINDQGQDCGKDDKAQHRIDVGVKHALNGVLARTAP